jgi:hypothetical protein
MALVTEAERAEPSVSTRLSRPISTDPELLQARINLRVAELKLLAVATAFMYDRCRRRDLPEQS